MKWKLKPNETIAYKAYMSENSPNGAKKIGFGGMFKSLGTDTAEAGMQKIMQQIQGLAPEYYIASLTEQKKDVIDIELIAKKKDKAKDKTTDEPGFAQLMDAMASGPSLRGAVHEDGAIQSFYLKTEQKNILALFFQLPAKPVKVGDEWQIDTHFTNMDQSFKCDSSFRKNVVKVTGIEDVSNDKVVVISYDIVEYVKGDFFFPFSPPGMESQKNIPTLYKTIFKATARFSIEKGRWLSYEGELQSVITGIMQAEGTQRYALVN
jgi:hypothetical protein